MIVPKRWKNTIKNIESDIHSNIDSDHYPLRTTICITLKAKYEKESTRYEYAPCNDDQKEKYNEEIRKQLKNAPSNETYKHLSNALHHSAKEHIPQTPKYQRKDQITPAAAQII